jgi:hypothetical protein
MHRERWLGNLGIAQALHRFGALAERPVDIRDAIAAALGSVKEGLTQLCLQFTCQFQSHSADTLGNVSKGRILVWPGVDRFGVLGQGLQLAEGCPRQVH